MASRTLLLLSLALALAALATAANTPISAHLARGTAADAMAAVPTPINADSTTPKPSVGCFWDSGFGASYDLSKLVSSTSYKVYDRFAGHSTQNYTYIFNVCANVAGIPGAGPGGLGNKCQTTVGSKGEVHSGPAAAFQVANWYNGCYRLGADVTQSAPTWSLADPDDPSRGVVMTLNDGDTCPNGLNRQLKLTFWCGGGTDVFNVESTVMETKTCIYDIMLPTVYGCPLECPVSGDSVCNGHGICGYNPTNKLAQCYCNLGWGGADCTQQVSASSGNGGVVASLVVVCILLALVFGAVVFMYLKLRRLNVNPESFQALSGKFNELGMLAQ